MHGPSSCEVEVSLFGPGFGECSVVHLGGGRWVVVDSCIDAATGRPVALRYLQDIGVPYENVCLIVATHWHDDHVRGLSTVVDACTNARVCVPAILADRELGASIVAHDASPQTRVTSGVGEMRRILEIGAVRGLIRGGADRRLLALDGQELGHGNATEVWTLSPTDASLHRFLKAVQEKIAPKQRTQKQRVPTITPNECSIVVWISIGPVGILLGADLEEAGGCRGWSAILESTGRPNQTAGFFKVPHHGSSNAHHPEIWRQLLQDDPLYALAPYDRGHKLPSRKDVERMKAIAPRGFSTAHVARRSKQLPRTVEKIVKDFSIKLYPIYGGVGQVRTRTSDFSKGRFDGVELIGGASRIDELY
jgi:beta-lactamase superfamily II metal-dependent hydrolase